MRPKQLILRNIGPFAGEHSIDFDTLGSFFLIYGQTGAGKTTIFDAISYAFYGKPLGGRSGIMRNLRSHFADDYAVADVTLTFFIGAQLYRVKRRLPYTKEGRKNETPEEVSLELYENGSWVSKSFTNKRETDAAIQGLIKLSDTEFSRIVLLPQGEFAQFLRAPSSDKKDTLMHLFPITRYTELMQAAKTHADELQQEVRAIQTNLEALQSRFAYHRYESDSAELQNEIGRIRSEYGRVFDSWQEKTRVLQQEQMLSEKRQELRQVQEELEACRIREADIRSLKQKIEKAQRAAPLAVQVAQLRELAAACDADERQLREKQERLHMITDRLTALQRRQGEIDAKETEKNAALAPALDALDAREHAYRNLQAQLDLEKQLHEQIAKREQLNHFLHSHAQAAEHTRAQLAELSHDYDIHSEQVDRLQAEKQAAERLRLAASLAEQLEEGAPCPVCGSVHHPAPAHDTAQSAFSFDERIATAKRTAARLQTEKEKTQAALAGTEASYANYQKQIDERAAATEQLLLRYAEYGTEPFPQEKNAAEDRIKETVQRINAALQAYTASRKALTEKTALEEELRRLQHEQRTSAQQKNSAEQLVSGISAAVQEKRRQFDHAFSQLPQDIRSSAAGNTVDSSAAFRTSGSSETSCSKPAGAPRPDAETALEQCETLLQELKLTINAYRTDTAEATQTLERIRGELAAIEAHRDEHRQQHRQKTTQLESAYIIEGFSGLDELEQAVCTEDDLSRWQAETETFYERYAAYRQAATGLEKELSGMEPRDIDALQNEVDSLRQHYEEIQARLEVLNADKAKLEELHAQHTELTNHFNVKTTEAQGWVSLAKDLTGSNPRKLQFDTWILSAFLHEVTLFANKRLERMSEGRYRLAVSEEHGSGNSYRGLDLEIADAYTGKCRPSATLSGGETFMASISLALGLADSIQARAGGIRLDSMFIDEGFGSLDEKALENAIGILDEIRGDRMVGIISHVGELQSRIPQKIEVIKTGTGSSIRQPR